MWHVYLGTEKIGEVTNMDLAHQLIEMGYDVQKVRAEKAWWKSVIG